MNYLISYLLVVSIIANIILYFQMRKYKKRLENALLDMRQSSSDCRDYIFSLLLKNNDLKDEIQKYKLENRKV